MKRIINSIRVSFLYLAALLLVGSYPLTAMAAEPADTTAASTTVAAPAPSSDSVSPAPTSSDSTSLAPQTVQPPAPEAKKPTYTYNPTTRRWDSDKWRYSPTEKAYVAVPQPPAVVPQPPAPVTVVNPTASPQALNSSQVKPTAENTSTTSTATAIANALDSSAKTGDANVTRNTTAGNATTGNASAVTTILNNVNSTVTNTSNQKAATFVSDVMGDVNGDIMLQPMLLKAMLEAGSTGTANTTNSVTNTNQITNDINLSATSGNANVTGNTSAGNATTGNANTVANVMNIINSMVTANRSFVGTINIYGSLNGDILIAPDFIPQLLASNGASQNPVVPSGKTTSVTSNDTQSIVNNVALAAETGKAAVMNNTSAGNATTGNADTNVVLFNLSGKQVVASNSLLVFVNVLGKWVGVIVDAPVGASAAAVGNGVKSNTTTAPDLVVTTANASQITNNISLTSQSGDATVAGNTSAGNALTGNATASANIGNIVGTQLALSDWFGVLFINVFGSWQGSFGIDTPFGTKPVVSTGEKKKQSTGPMRVINFIPRAALSGGQQTKESAPFTLIDNRGGADGYSPSTEQLPQAKSASYVGNTSPSIESVTLPVKEVQPTREVVTRLPLLIAASFLTLLSAAGLKRTLFTPNGTA